MKIPKYIEKAIDRRIRLAQDLNSVCRIVDDFIIKHHIDDELDYCDFLTGVEIYGNPAASGRRVKQAILDHDDSNK